MNFMRRNAACSLLNEARINVVASADRAARTAGGILFLLVLT
jgi:hypothetical protein